MKITSVTVRDPGRLGYEVNVPQLIVTVDDGLYRQTLSTVDIGRWRIAEFGKLYRYWTGGGDTRISGRAGLINLDMALQKGTDCEPLVDIDAVQPVGADQQITAGGMAISLKLAERSVKRFAPNWMMAPVPSSVRRGELEWAPTEIVPTCLWRGKFSLAEEGDPPPCGKVATAPFMGRILGICDACKITADWVATVNRTTPVSGRPSIRR